MAFLPDPKGAAPIRDPAARKAYHLSARRVCAICPETRDLSLHHVFDRDDVPGNFVLLCGDGVRGCHGLITNENRGARVGLGRHIKWHRPDVVAHVRSKIGDDRAREWFLRRLFVSV